MKTLVTVILLSLALPATAGGVTWGAEERLTTTSTDSETGLNHTPLARDAAGRLHVVWAEQDGVRGNYQVYTRRRVGGTWATPALVVPVRLEAIGSLLGAKFPSIVRGPGDTLHVAWHDYRNGGIDNCEIYAKSCPAAAPWDTSVAAEIRLTTTSHPESGGDNGLVPTLAADRYGTLHLAWYDFRYNGEAGEILYKARLNGAWDTTPGDAADLNVSMTAGDSQFPALAVDNWGNAHLAWQDDNRILYAVRNGLTGAVSAPELLSTAAAPAVTPALAVDGTGRLYAAWVDSRDGSRRIYARQKPFGGAWTPERPATPAGFNADEPALAIDRYAGVHLAWHDTRVSALNREIFVQAALPGAEWDSTAADDVRISNGSGNSTRPSLHADEEGHLYVVWKDRRDGNNEIYFREGTVPAPVSDAGESRGDGFIASFRTALNPFRTGTTFQWRAGAADIGPRRVTIADVAGHLIRSEVLSGSEESWTWDGRDDHERSVVSGVYYVTLAPAGGRASTIAVVKVR